MSEVTEEPVIKPVAGRAADRWSVLLALIPALVFVQADLVVGQLAGHPDRFPSVGAYRAVLNLESLLRYGGLFVAVLFVWGALRSRGAPRWVLALAVLSGPLAYALVEFVRAQAFFPPGQAAYYAIGPLFVGGVASQCAMAAVGEALWRWWGRRRGVNRGRAVTWRILLIAVSGWAILYVTLLWDGGIHWFYLYQQVYKALFARR